MPSIFNVFKRRMLSILCITAAVVFVLDNGCYSDMNDTKAGGDNSNRSWVMQDHAINIAKKALKAEIGEFDQDQYEITVEERKMEWVVSFERKPPRPPGDEFAVYVNKTDGTTRVMRGE